MLGNQIPNTVQTFWNKHTNFNGLGNGKLTNVFSFFFFLFSFFFFLFSFFFFLSSGTNVTVRIPVPKATVSASHEPLGPGQSSELRLPDKTNIWKIKKIDGGSELILILKVLY